MSECTETATSRKNKCVFETGARNFKIQEMLLYLKGKGLVLLIDGRKYLDERQILEYFTFLKRAHNIKISIVGANQIEKGERGFTIDTFLLYCEELGCRVDILAVQDSICTRIAFGAALRFQRRFQGLLLKDVSARMLIQEGNVYRYEAGSNNYKICECLRYIEAIKHVLHLNGKPFERAAHIAAFLSSNRKKSGLKNFCSIVGLSNNVIYQAETGKTELTIDTLLAYCRVLDIKIEIRPKETVTLVGGNGTNINE